MGSTWTWVSTGLSFPSTSSVLPYANWQQSPLEPSGDGPCLEMVGHHWSWNDSPCHYEFNGHICQFVGTPPPIPPMSPPAGPPTPPRPPWCFETGFDYNGNDMSATNGLTTPDAYGCQGACQSISGCNYFMWRPGDNRCWGKTSIAPGGNAAGTALGRVPIDCQYVVAGQAYNCSDYVGGPKMC